MLLISFVCSMSLAIVIINREISKGKKLAEIINNDVEWQQQYYIK